MKQHYLALFVALALSVVAAYYSIIGLAAIFSSAQVPVIIMGSVLELAKVVTASWLYRNWRDTPRMIRYYLAASVAVLMFITSMGIFGFLSRAHIEQQIALSSGSGQQVEIIDNKILFEEEQIKDLDTQITQIDNAIKSLTEKGQAKSSLRAAEQQRKNRDELTKRKSDHLSTIASLKNEKVKVEGEVRKLEAEVGPLKYIAELVYENADTNQLEKAVRWVIILIILVFDPLAVLLLIAANNGLMRNKEQEIQRLTFDEDDDKIHIDKDAIIKL